MTTAEGSDFALVGASATEMFTSTAHATFGNPGLAVANAAGISGGTPAGSLFSIYGSGLSTTIGQEVTTIWPTTLANASVTVNGESAPLYYVSPTQINAQMPLDIAPGYATVIVKTGSTASNTVVSNSVAAIVPATANPGVLIYGSNRAVAQNLPSYTLNSTSAPAPSGSYIVVYFTGGGPVQGGSALVTGHAAPSNVTYPLTETYSATIGGINAPIVFIGLAPGFVGLYQADIQVPTIATGSHNLIMTVGGTPSNTTVISTN
jgi:adhesin/invasin